MVKARARDQNGLGLKPTRTILILWCPWERHFTAHSPAWWSWQAILNYSHVSIKLQADSNILVSPEQGCELELELELEELGNFGRTRTRKIKISELELELELEKSL